MKKATVEGNLVERKLIVSGDITEKYARKLANDFMSNVWSIDMQNAWVTNPFKKKGAWHFDVFSSVHDFLDAFIKGYDPEHRYIKEVVEYYKNKEKEL